MNYEVFGRVVEAKSGRGVPGVVVSAYDKDPVFDDFLGDALSTVTGDFRIVYDESRFKSLLDRKPDIYIKAKTLAGQELLDAKGATRFDASPREEIKVVLDADLLTKAGLAATDGDPRQPISRAALTTLTCLADVPGGDDDLVKQIRNDLAGTASVLEMFRNWMADLRGTVDNNALPYRKMARLFELGATPERMPGHHYGIAPGLRTGDLKGIAADIGNFMGFVWGTVLGDATPWVGKSMNPMTEADRRQILGPTGGSIPDNVPLFRGINHFNVLENRILNVGLGGVLKFMWGLKTATDAERLQLGYDRNGGHFTGHRARSVYAGTPREVFRLNYRHKGFGNNWPLFYLIDELVQIGDGLFLGQVLFATDHLLETYDPAAPDERYHYQNFGYFLLMQPQWRGEAQRLFPHLEIPDAAVTNRIEGGPAAPDPKLTAKLSTLTLAPAGDGNYGGKVDAATLAAVKQDLAQKETVIDLIKSYSDTLRQEQNTKSPVFDKLAALFNAGISPKRVTGFYRGALVSWQLDGPLKAARLNGFGLAWEAIRSFSPWTGKTFAPIDKKKLAELTEGFETGEVETFSCANTVVFRNERERFIRTLARAVDAPMEEATTEERRLYGFDAKTFFFLSKAAPSIHPENGGKQVFQFNYRWKALRNPIPDRYCIDEIVQIAEGLYLGQLSYAMDWFEAWDPKTPIAKYKYGLFAYFMLMDEDWHARRLKIGYDLDNT
jgi:hypothetical protein